MADDHHHLHIGRVWTFKFAYVAVDSICSEQLHKDYHRRFGKRVRMIIRFAVTGGIVGSGHVTLFDVGC